ncbi:ferrous iron transport protein B [Rhodothalassium salexigens DSM 2132]|uniref:Fe(2+) transporter FeoB n=1 Tax=Rhodothalassium salexigens DSM 2132 TaxID=1188247 RepID=A0A4R2P923_RHOSA|nr:ferrous iron transporter B [Rhodothalassium salexigens]MBB4212449.1 ferrous iron transport protein B [Rhodothalassium salexigens DSM 2132]MBK1639930.1 ferrous iron transporter B [Rhodothalassium salexigens DSM 2132]TCP31509.1 ferrous iron transport protein B [Rhodothalassium salexigens DSM 2132]
MDVVTQRPLRLALVGNPNCGKTALFNALTGTRQKVANYPGVTVERRAGRVTGHHLDAEIEVIDLPGTYSLRAHSADEEVTRDVVTGRFEAEAPPDGVICVVDATNLRRHLRFVLELKGLGLPVVVALNMIDLAERDGLDIDVDRLSHLLDVPVVPTSALRRRGLDMLIGTVETTLAKPPVAEPSDGTRTSASASPGDAAPSRRDLRALQAEAKRIAAQAIRAEGREHALTRRLDAVLLHPVAGPVILTVLLFLVFQAVFSWAEAPMNWIDGGIVALQGLIARTLPAGALNDVLVDGVLAGVGSVVIFLPQILILFTFILLLEMTGYMVRAAFLMDRLMAGVGLNGRAFIPLLSSFACAIPGIMAARTIDHPRDRLTTILIAPLMTCSARLPVYALIIAAFIPDRQLGGLANLQGVVMFGLYLAGVVSALVIAFILKLTLSRGQAQPLIMELPKYQIPSLTTLAIGLLERAKIFLARAGKVILVVSIVLWGLASFPGPPPGATEPAIFYSIAGWIGRGLEVVLAPIGFDWQIATALVPGMAAREVVVGALGTVYAMSGEVTEASLAGTLRSAWSLPTALSFLAWYVFAPQCISTMAVIRRETNSARMPLFVAAYMFALAYLAAFITYRVSSAFLGA